MLDWGITAGCIVSRDFIKAVIEDWGRCWSQRAKVQKKKKNDYLKWFHFSCSHFLFLCYQ